MRNIWHCLCDANQPAMTTLKKQTQQTEFELPSIKVKAWKRMTL